MAEQLSPEWPSPEWLHQLDGALAASTELAEAVGDDPLVIAYRIRDVPGGGPGTSYHLRLDPQGCGAGPGEGTADVTFERDRPTADAIHRGERRAQRVFMAGELRLSGDTQRLLGRAELLARLDEVVASLDTGRDPTQD